MSVLAIREVLFNGVPVPPGYTGTTLYLSLHTGDPGIGTNCPQVSFKGYARFKGARLRKARWKLRHAMHVKHRRKPHPMRRVRDAQRMVRQYDDLERAGALWVIGQGARP